MSTTNPYRHLKRPVYPWPCTIHPHDAELTAWGTDLVDRYYGAFSEEIAEKYRNNDLGHAGACIVPYGTVDQVKHMSTAMVYGTAADDYCEHATTFHDIDAFATRLHEVLLAAPVLAEDNPILQVAGFAAQQLRAVTPPEFMVRHASTMRDYLVRGAGRERAYRRSRTIPAPADLMAIREYSIGMLLTTDLYELVLPYTLPTSIAVHPLITRMRTLICHMAIFQNDIVSAGWEFERMGEGEIMNTLFSYTHHWGLSPEQSYALVLHLNQQTIDEFTHLQHALPDFGEHTGVVEEYLALGAGALMGWENWYSGTTRYISEHPEPDWAFPAVNDPHHHLTN